MNKRVLGIFLCFTVLALIGLAFLYSPETSKSSVSKESAGGDAQRAATSLQDFESPQNSPSKKSKAKTEIGEKVLAVSLRKVSQIKDSSKLNHLNQAVKNIITEKTNCVFDLSCVDEDVEETNFTSPNYTPEHDKLRKALGMQRILLEKGLKASLSGETIEKLLSMKNEEIKNEVLAIMHLDGSYSNQLAEHLDESGEAYIQSGDFNDIHKMDELISGEKAQSAYSQLITKFVADTSIPVESYLYKINDINVTSNQKAGIFKTICSNHRLQKTQFSVMRKFYSLNGIKDFENECFQ